MFNVYFNYDLILTNIEWLYNCYFFLVVLYNYSCILFLYLITHCLQLVINITGYGLLISNYNSTVYLYTVLGFNNSIIYACKFSVSILFLIFIRAGIPRYRYDFLTKLGWVKFFLFTFLFFTLNYFIFMCY